jgi:ABC-2 type transport system ATP-binding protein
MSDQDIAIRVDNVSKSFKLPHEKHGSIKSLFVNGFRGKRTYEKQEVLKDVSLEVKKGEFFGIVGRNGSGKSTLLKLLAGIYSPDSGGVKVNGKLTPFIELGVGFNPELTGRDNVFLNGSLLGFSRKEMEEMYDDIVEFAELEKFMDQKLKNYSSGMQVRLAFSIAIQAKSDILLLDEVLAVGDEAFQRKCYQYFAEIKRQKQTVVLVTHNMDAIQQFCNKAALIDKGHKTVVGNPLKVTQIYRELNSQDGETVNKTKDKSETSTKYVSARMKHTKSKGKHIFDISLKPKVTIYDPIVAMGIYRDTGEQVYRWTSDEKVPFKLNLKTHQQVRIEIADTFPVGFFTVNLFIKKRDRTMNYATFNEIAKFEVKNLTPYDYAVFWKVPDNSLINGEEV